MEHLVNPTEGFLVVRRINWFTELPVDNPIKRLPDRFPAISLSHEEIRVRYRGFDGLPWPDSTNMKLPPLQRGLASLEQYNVVESYFHEVSQNNLCDLIYLNFLNDSNFLRSLPEKFSFLGYDYGYYLSEYNVYSSLFHEVIYGLYSEMKDYAKFLNSYLLLPSLEMIEPLDRSRKQLLETSADLERDEPCVAIAIYGSPLLPNSLK